MEARAPARGARSAPAFERAAPPSPRAPSRWARRSGRADHRGLASAKLCRRLLEGVGGRRPELERAVLALTRRHNCRGAAGDRLRRPPPLHVRARRGTARRRVLEAVALSKAYSGSTTRWSTACRGVRAGHEEPRREVDTSPGQSYFAPLGRRRYVGLSAWPGIERCVGTAAGASGGGREESPRVCSRERSPSGIERAVADDAAQQHARWTSVLFTMVT